MNADWTDFTDFLFFSVFIRTNPCQFVYEYSSGGSHE